MKPSAGERAAQILLALLKAGCYVALFLGSQLLVMMPVMVASGIRSAIEGKSADEELLSQMLTEQAMTYSLVANLLTLVIILTFYLVRRKKFSEALWLRRVDAPTLWEGAALAPGLYLVVAFVLAALPESWMDSYNEASSGVVSGGVVGVLAVVVAAPVVEEVVFRGLVMTRLSQAMPGWLAVVLSAAIFGVCHGNPVWFGYAFVLGVVFGVMDLRAGSIWPSILGHITFNSFSQILSALPENEGAELAAIATMVVVAIVAPILDRKAIAAIFRSRPKTIPVQELPLLPGVYEFDPWDA